MNGDLISRDALIQHAYSAVVDGVEKDIIDLSDVDNAPTVDIKDEIAGAYNEGYACGSRENKRPQGEWIGDTDYESYQGYYEAYKCSRCGYGLHWRDYTNEYKFCPNCGADMRKGGAE